MQSSSARTPACKQRSRRNERHLVSTEVDKSRGVLGRFLEIFGECGFVGDRGVRVSTLRGSEYTPYLVSPITAGLGWTSVPFLPCIKAPTLVMSGNDDPLIPSCNAKIIAGLIPNSELNIFHGGHLALVTEADVHAPEVEAFLDRIGD